MSSNSRIAECLVCGKKKQYGKVLQFFKFPYEIARCKSWVKAIGMRELLFMPLEKLREQVVCVEHFDAESIRYNHLHRSALPSNTPYPPLSDEDIRDFPKRIRKEREYTVKFNGSDKRKSKIDPPTTISELESVIDYERPLMESLGTLVHNDRHAVQKPAGRLNSIAVPLMTYSSSLEKGTVFAAADPGKNYDLPFVPFIEANSQNECTNNKRYTNVKAITQSTNWNVTNIPAASNLESSLKEFIKTTEPVHNNTLVGKVKPNIKTVEHVSKTHRNYNVSIGLNTLIKGNPRKVSKDPNIKIPESSRKLPSKVPEDRYKNIKQYTNNRLTTHSFKKNKPIIIKNEMTSQRTTASLPEEDQLVENTNTAKEALHVSEYVSLVSATSAEFNHEVPANSLDANGNSAKNDSLETVEAKSESTNSELTFVPYSQYNATVTPESPNAHTGEGTLDYGLPLMNCIGTVFQGNIQSTIKTNKTEDVIDVPLMKCLKTLEHMTTL